MIRGLYGAGRLLGLAAVLGGVAGAARANTTIDLGTITAAGSAPVSSFVAGLFTDNFEFTVPAGETLTFSAALNTDPNGLSASKFIFQNLQVKLLEDGAVVRFGTGGAGVIDNRPATVMTFSDDVLGPGSYALQISANEFFLGSSIPVATSYAGKLNFDDVTVASAVPEPASTTTWLVGLAALGATLAWRRRPGFGDRA
jgi:MYXO-CTERM domain-containing protein